MADTIQPIWSVNLDTTHAIAADLKRQCNSVRQLQRNSRLNKSIKKLWFTSNPARATHIFLLLQKSMYYILQEDYDNALAPAMEAELLLKPSDSDVNFRVLNMCLAGMFHNQRYFKVGIAYALVGAYKIQTAPYTEFEQNLIEQAVQPSCFDIIDKACRLFLDLDPVRDDSKLQHFRTVYLKNKPYTSIIRAQQRIRDAKLESHICEDDHYMCSRDHFVFLSLNYLMQTSEIKIDFDEVKKQGKASNIGFLNDMCSSKAPLWIYPDGKLLLIKVKN
ncbi:MAG: hypothetical protein GY928_23295 [Colwellia sp.]|nr:hypothetical protein [Colwellia sp.]